MKEELTQNIGYRNVFLSPDLIDLPFFSNVSSEYQNYGLSHHHYLSIYFNTNRKLPLYSACNYDKTKFIEKDETGKTLKRGSFKLDKNINKEFQLGQGFYYSKTIDHPTEKNKNVFDRGHIISRRYTQWGDNVFEAKRNADETFYFTNIAPQTWQLNQNEWEEIEAFVIEHKKLKVKKASIFSGIIFRENDPIATYLDKYKKKKLELKIPVLYWKIVYYKVDDELRRVAFMLSQDSAMRKLDFLEFKEQEGIREDPFMKLNNKLKTFIVKVSLIEEHTSLKFASAIEKFGEEEPLEVVIEDNNIEEGLSPDRLLNKSLRLSNISKFI
tara:strand:+ start:5983 stop:6963 length:981 start_codon:yes stop_codon:yes gene_type:complete